MRQTLEHWKEAVGVLLYFGFLAYFTPRAKALGWGMEGTMFCVVGGAVLIGLLYLLVKCISDYVESHRDEVDSYREYMGLGSSIPHAQLALTTGDDYTDAELDAMLATNPYASVELFSDEKYTRLLPSVDADDEEEETRLVDEPEDEELLGGQDTLNLGPTLQVHADGLLSKRKVILGVSGSGKTNNMIVYCEELGKLKPAPALILFDTDDENRGLCDRKYLPNPVLLEKSTGLTISNAFATAQIILEKRHQCIINLQSYEEEEAAWIMINMVRGVRAWQEARRVRVPCEIVLDEASVWLPQNPRESLLSSILIDDPDAASDGDEEDEGDLLMGRKEPASRKISLLTLLQRTFFTVARRGRRRGMGLTLAAQRIAEIDKRALQASWMFLMKQTQPADWREYRHYGISPQEAMELLEGEAFVFAPGVPRERHRLRLSDSPHGGVTPGMEALRGSIREEWGERRADAPMTTSRRLPTVSHQQDLQPARTALREQIAFRQPGANVSLTPLRAAPEAFRPVAPQPAGWQAPTTVPAPDSRHNAERAYHTAKGMGAELQAAYEAYQPGMTHHALARRLDTTPAAAGQLLKQLQQRGLIDAVGKKQEEKVVPIERKTSLRAGDIDLDEAIAAWNAGYNSEDKLMRRFPGLNKYQAGLLRDRMFPPAPRQMNG